MSSSKAVTIKFDNIGLDTSPTLQSNTPYVTSVGFKWVINSLMPLFPLDEKDNSVPFDVWPPSW